MLAQRIRRCTQVFLKTNRFLIFLTRGKSTAIVNLAITHELLQLKWEICRKLNRAFHVLGFYWLTEIQSDSLLYVRENKEAFS